MGTATKQSATALPADMPARRSAAAISPRVRTILEDLITSGQIGDKRRQLVALLRGREYSIADLVRDVNAAKTELLPPHPDFFDELLAACIDDTSVVHEAAIENMLNGFCELTETGEILYANPALRSLLPDCEGRQLTDYFPRHAAELDEALSASADKRVYRLELEALDHPRPVLAEFGLVPGGATAYAFISDLTHAQDVQRRAHDSAPFAILKLDPDHRITYANEPASKLLGGTPQTVVGRDAASLVQGPRDVEALEREYEKRRRGETSEYELDVKPINLMPPARVVVRSFPESDPDGRLASTLVTLSPVTPELTAQRILDEISGANEAGTLFARVLDHLRPLVTFDAAILSVSTPNHEFSRVAFSEPASEVNALWIPIPEALRGIADEPEPFGSNLRKKLLTTHDGERLLDQDVVQEQLDRGLHGWYALSIKDCGRDAVLTLLHTGDCYGPDTTATLDKAGTRQAMQAVLRLDVAREKDFQFKLLKDIARAKTDRQLAHLVVTELAGFYRWQNVSVFKVNALQRQFELLEQAKAGNDGFLLPFEYCQPLDTGYLGKAFHQGEIQVVPDALASPYKETFVGATTKTRSEMCVPIQLQEQVVWILNLEDTRPNAFEAPERETVERLLSELVRSLERALSSALLDEVLNEVPDAVIITDLAGKILKCNLSARDMLGGEPKNELLADFFAPGSEGAAAVSSQTSYPVKGALVGLDRTETNVLIRTRIPSVQYDRRVVFMQDSDKLNWQAETRELMQALANVASQVRVPLSLVSSFVRQIGRQAADQAPRLAEMAKRAVDQLGRVELTYNRVIGQVNRIGHPELVDVDALLATLLTELLPDRGERVQPSDPAPRAWADRGQFASALRAMLAYLLRIGDADASIDIRTRVFGDAVGITMSKPTAIVTQGIDRFGAAASSPEIFAPNPADEAFARYALDEPGLNQFAINHHGLFRRRRTAYGETLRLVLRTKDATCTTG